MIFLLLTLLFYLKQTSTTFLTYIILVTADRKIRLNRALKRNNLDLSQIKKRMNLQLSDEKKIKLSDFVIYNNKDKKNLESRV